MGKRLAVGMMVGLVRMTLKYAHPISRLLFYPESGKLYCYFGRSN